MYRRGRAASVAAALLTLGLGSTATVAFGHGADGDGSDSDRAAAVQQGESGTISPDGPLPAANRFQQDISAQLALGIQERREAAGAPPAGKPTGGSNAKESVEAPESEGNRVTRNQLNTRAQVVSSTLAEPAAANDASEVMWGGNTYFARSANNGINWTAESIAAGPADAPNVCCDLDVVHHRVLDTTFAIALFTNSALTNGVVRIYVRRATIAGGNDCTYTIDPGGTGTLLPDYPHIAVSDTYLYLTTNNIGPSGWTGSQIRRFNASQMANCTTAATTTINYTGTDGQRILTPVEGATNRMYFGLNRSANVFRVIRWQESQTTISSFDRTLSHGSNFANPDCRGGTGNFDFIDRSTSFSIAGFRLRGAVVPNNRMWFLWNAASDASHPQAHLHSAIISEPGLSLLTSPSVFNSTRCFGYPTLASNTSAEFGLTFAHGGRAGGGGSAAQGAIMVDDAASAGNFFPSWSTTATGTHNRSDNRYGDYFTARKNDGCTRGWVATNFALNGGNTAPSHVNARYVKFQSSTVADCP